MEAEDMVERVARAVVAKVKIVIDPDNGPLIVNPLESARAAIEAMREPTQSMANEGWDAACTMVQNSGRRAPQAVFAIGGEIPVWQAMIDAALSPTGRGGGE